VTSGRNANIVEVIATPLSAREFAPFGDVIQAGSSAELINRGTTRKYSDLAQLTLSQQSGRPAVHLYRASPCRPPLEIEGLECHPLSSQLFMPLASRAFLIVVAPAGPLVDPAAIRAFLSQAGQGVNFHPGVWHHPLLALQEVSDFLVLDRIGPGENCEEFPIRAGVKLPGS